MRKTFATISILILALSIFCSGCKKKTPANNEPPTPPAPIEFTIDNYVYQVNDDGVSATLTECIDLQHLSGDVNIPEKVSYDGKEYTVTVIGDGAFGNCWQELGSLNLPNTIIKIGDYAFYSCGLTGSLNLPSSLTYIGENAFSGCHNITGSLYIPDSVTFLGNNAFNSCFSLNGTLHISRNLTTINEGAFAFCDQLMGTLYIPKSVTVIGDFAFDYCYGFTSYLEIPESVTYIGLAAFSNCKKLSGVVSLATEAPTLRGDVFPYNTYTTLTVPCHCSYQYEHSPWILYFENIVEDCDTSSRHIDRSEVEKSLN